MKLILCLSLAPNFTVFSWFLKGYASITLNKNLFPKSKLYEKVMLSENIISLHSYSCCKIKAHTMTRATLLPSEQTHADTQVVVVKLMRELEVQTAGTKGFRARHVFLTAATQQT